MEALGAYLSERSWGSVREDGTAWEYFPHDHVSIEYTKSGIEDILIRITATNRGPEPAELHLLPTL